MLRLPGLLTISAFFLPVLTAASLAQSEPGTPGSGIGVTSTTPSLAQIGAAILGRTAAQSITLTGEVVHNSSSASGSTEQVTDPISLTINSDGTTEVQISGSSGNMTENFAAAGVTGQCTSSMDTNTPAIAAANCWSAASWVLPTLHLANSTAAARISASLAATTKAGNPTLQLQMQIPLTGHSSSIGKYITTVSSRTIYLDPATFLPLSMTYSEHPGAKTYISIPVEILYSNYTAVDGVTVPFSVIKKVNGHAELNITISQASIR